LPRQGRLTLGERREHGEHRIDPLRALPGVAPAGDEKILPHRHAGKGAAALRAVADAQAGSAVRTHGLDGSAVEQDAAGSGTQQADDGFHQRRFARAVRTEQRHRFVGGDGDGDAAQGRYRAVAHLQSLDRQQGHGGVPR
jgi:hypothetical protein